MSSQPTLIKVALADDHVILRKSLAMLIDGFENYKVIWQADNGKELINAISNGKIPDVVILDQNMPVMDGFETAKWLFTHNPQVHILMLTMYDAELYMIRLLQYGVKGFLKKDVHPSELKFAIESVMETGFYYPKHTSSKLINLFKNNQAGKAPIQSMLFSDREIEFMKLCTTEMDYKEISQKMKLSGRTVEKLRSGLFEKLGVQNRWGVVMIAMRNGLGRF
jgi:DNA-binding NarL/FixJ family response regulator